MRRESEKGRAEERERGRGGGASEVAHHFTPEAGAS